MTSIYIRVNGKMAKFVADGRVSHAEAKSTLKTMRIKFSGAVMLVYDEA